MNKQTTILLIILFTISNCYSQKHYYNGNISKDGLRIIESKSKLIRLSFAIEEFVLQNTKVENTSMSRIIWGNAFLPGKEGFPELPSVTKNLVIPNDAEVEIIISKSEKEKKGNIIIAPAAKTPGELQAPFEAKRGGQYQTDSFYPESPIQYSITEIRGFKVVRVSVVPFQYNAVSKELIINKNLDIEIKISSKSQKYGENRFRSIFWDQVFADIIYNYNDIPPIDYHKSRSFRKEDGCDFLILSPNKSEFLQWADTIRRFRNEQGIYTKIITTEEIGSNNPDVIHDFIEEIYQTWNPVPSAILILGDHHNGNDGVLSYSFHDHPEPVTSYATDNYYIDFTNNDLPDIVIGRIPANNEMELQVMIKKYINYETSPPTKYSFYKNPLSICGYQSNLWFQMCSESISGYMRQALGKNPIRINELCNWSIENSPLTDPWSFAPNTELPLNYFGQNGLAYIPLKPADVGPWGGGNADDIISAIDSGSFMVLLRDHGGSEYFAVPEFTIEDAKRLNNPHYPTHFFSMACFNGSFNYGYPSLIETLYGHNQGGIISGTAASTWSWSFYNDCITWGMFDNLWPGFMPDNGYETIAFREFRPAFGLAASKYYMMNSNWITNDIRKIITSRIWHHFGDPFGIIYTSVPMENTVDHVYSITNDVTSIEVEAEPLSLVGLSVDGELLCSSITNDIGKTTLNFQNQELFTKLKLVITKQNFLRYEEDIYVVPDEGPYLVFKGHKLNQDANQNGQLDYNETVSVDIKLRNYGVNNCIDAQMKIIENGEFYQILNQTITEIDEIPANTEIVLENILEFQTDLNIPDQFKCQFQYEFENTAHLLNGHFSIIANSPVLYYHPMQFEEIIGNENNVPEPGETINVMVQLNNIGHSTLIESEINIENLNPLIDISNYQTTIDQVLAGDSLIITYQMEISEEAGNQISYVNKYHIESIDHKIFTKDHYFNMGFIIEDFESGNFDQFDWHFEGDREWEITSDFVHEGDFSATIQGLDDNEEASLILDYFIYDDNNIKFYYQVSSQTNKDFLSFYVDTTLIYKWSNLHLFGSSQEFLVPKGLHSLKWVYKKDEESSGGLDAVWLDYIMLPPGTKPTGVDFVDNEKQGGQFFYPNPSSDYIIISNDKHETIESMSLINIQGQVFYTEEINCKPNSNYHINLHGIKPGIYVVEITFVDQTSNRNKLIIL